MRPLYLHGKDRMAVSLDGPALKVAQRGSAVRRFPFARISRVVVSGPAFWSTQALLACADEGITVSFLAADGAPRARWIGRCTDRDGFLQRWRDFQDRPDWLDLYRQWRRASARRAVRLCAWRMGWSPTTDTRTIAQVVLQTVRSKAGGRALRRVRGRLRGLAHARSIEQLGRLGMEAKETCVSPLVPALMTTIYWGLLPDLNRWLEDGEGRHNRVDGPSVASPASVVAFFERHARTTDFHLRDIVRRLQRYLTELQ